MRVPLWGRRGAYQQFTVEKYARGRGNWRPHLCKGSGTHVKFGRKEHSTEKFDPVAADGGSVPSGNGAPQGNGKSNGSPARARRGRHATGGVIEETPTRVARVPKLAMPPRPSLSSSFFKAGWPTTHK